MNTIMKNRTLAALTAIAAAALILTGCATSAGSNTLPDPVNLTVAEEAATLCGDPAGEVLDFVETAAEADPDSGQRKALSKWGVTDVTDDVQIQAVIETTTLRAGTPCVDPEEGAASIGVEDNDGSVKILPVYEAAETIVLDSTQDPSTPPLGVSLLDASKRYIIQALSWQGVVQAVGEEGWYANGVNSYAAQSGFSWEDAQKFASVNYIKDGKVVGNNALVIQVFNRPDLTEEAAEDLLIEAFGPEQVKEFEKVTQVSIRKLPIQWINGGFSNTRNVGTAQYPQMGEFFDKSEMVRISLMPIKFDEAGTPVALDGSRGAGIFIDCLNLHWVPKAIWVCTDASCDKPLPPPPPYIPPTVVPECVYDCGNTSKDWDLSVTNTETWTPLQAGPLTNGQLSQEQLQSGDTSGNVIDNQVSIETENGDTTTELDTGTVDETGLGIETGGDDREDDVVDDTVTNQDEGGTEGDNCITDPDTGESTCE